MSKIIYYLDTIGLLLSAVSMASLAAYIYFKNRKSSVNRVFSLLLFLISLSTFATLLKAVINVAGWVVFFSRFAVSLYSLINATLLYFCIIFPEEKYISKRLIIALYAPAVFFALVSIFTDGILKGLQPSNVKYLYLSPEIYGPLLIYYSFYTFIYVIAGSMSLIIYKLVKSSGVQRKKLFILIFAIILGTINLTVFTLALRLVGIVRFDTLGQMTLILCATMMSYSIVKYKLFTITPQVAAEEILTTLEKSILVTDPSGNILFQGKITPQPDQPQIQKIVDTTLSEGDLKRYTIMVDHTSFNISTSTFPGGGVVILFDDLTKIEEEEDKEKTTHNKLEEILKREQALIKLLAEITADVKIDGSIKSLRSVLANDPNAVKAIENMANLKLKRVQMLEAVKKDKEALEKNFAHIKEINQSLVERELRMAELKESIQKAIESKKDQKERDERMAEFTKLMNQMTRQPPTPPDNS
jgi:hypothetical protein